MPEEEKNSRALGGLLEGLLRRSRTEIERVGARARVQLDLRQLRQDRDAMYTKLGREVRALLEGGEISHPGLAHGVERIKELERKIALVDADAATAGTAAAGEGEAPEEQP